MLASCGFVAYFCLVINNNVCASVVSVYGRRRVFRVVKNESLRGVKPCYPFFEDLKYEM